jgi:alcohol dehydrogenase class IV
MEFIFEPARSRVVFGAGCIARLGAEVDLLGVSRILIVGTPGRSELLGRARELLAGRVAGTFGGAVVHVPGKVAEDARESASAHRADAILAVGGGSAIGAAKAIALTTDLPIIALPTTYSGSEMTPLWGLTQDGAKRTGRDLRVQPRTVLYDPELSLDLPVSVSATSGMNAIAHCVEALYAPDANPVTSWMAEEGIRSLAASLLAIAVSPRDLAARTQAMYGAWLAGSALGAVQMGLHHKLCHTLGGSFNLPHAETHSVLLPYTAAYNMSAAGEAMRTVERALGESPAPRALYDLERRLGTPESLAAIGLSSDDLERAADLAVERPYPNPRPVTREGVLTLLQRAFEGSPAG